MQPVVVDSDDELDLRHYIDVLWRRKLIIIVVGLLVMGVAAGLSARQDDQYRASASVLLQGNEAEQRLGAATDPAAAAYNRVETEIGVIQSDVVRAAAAENLGFEPGVSVSAVGETDIVRISSVSTDPSRAALVANTYAESYVEWRKNRTVQDLLDAQNTVQAEVDDLEGQLAELEQPVEELRNQLFVTESTEEREAIQARIADVEEEISTEVDALTSQISLYRSELSDLQVSQRITRTGGVQIVTPASVPAVPFAPQPLRNAVLGLVVGLMLGVGLAFLFETLDDRVRSKQQLETATGWPTVGLIPVIAGAKKGQPDLVTRDKPSSPTAEAYRTLRTAIQFLSIERPLSVIQVTSANSGDGKTATAANLAITMAKTHDRVLLIDADLRRPRIHHEFGLANDVGFTSVLLGESAPEDSLHHVGPEGLIVLPSGPPPPNPSEVLAMRRTRELINRLRSLCDVIIIDSPPVLPVTDPLVISGYVDGVLLVTDAATARARELGRTRELLEQVSAKVIGITVNRVSADAGYAYGYGYGYGYAPEDDGDAAGSQSNGASTRSRRRSGTSS